MKMAIDLSPTGRGRVIVVTVLVTLGCIALSFALNSMGVTAFDQSNWTTVLLVCVVVPVVVAFPVIFFLMSKLRELALAHRELQLVASTDSLTAVLNRGAFTMLVEAYLEQTRLADDEIRGALLVVDADHFKELNDRYGHDQGDVALRLIAQAIKGALRGADLVGRIGGEEFGVFLPGSDKVHAAGIAERIRASVRNADFRPDGEHRAISVSVGGASFARRIGFSELFRIADQRLYDAKHEGRDRVMVAPIVFAAAA